MSTAGLRLGSGSQSAFFHDDHGISADGPLLASGAGSSEPFLMVQGDEVEPWFGPWGVFLSGTGAFGNKDATGSVDGFDFMLPGVTAGVDYSTMGHDCAIRSGAPVYRSLELEKFEEGDYFFVPG